MINYTQTLAVRRIFPVFQPEGTEASQTAIMDSSVLEVLKRVSDTPDPSSLRYLRLMLSYRLDDFN